MHETLDSFIAQTYENWECLLVDDGSTDTTVEVIKTYTIKDDRFKLYNRPQNRPKGANACRNYGFEQSSGAFINWFDSDDIAAPQFLEQKIKLLEDHPEIDMAACYGERFYDDARENTYMKPVDDKSDNEIENYILHDFCFYTNSPLWRKDILIKNAEIFDEEMHRSQEKDFHFRMLVKGFSYKRYVEKPLFFKRGDNDSISTNAEKSINAKLSVFRLREKQFDLINASNNKSKKKLLEYLFYRQAVNYYDVMIALDSKAEKKVFRKKYFPQLISMIRQTHLETSYKNKLFLGDFLLQSLNKGYKFFYFPQFDHRSF
ncbi:glycosyl transferase [Patiriisocius marinistellae]|uniref:Glycosyl transferase n=1 Tax=Patiriisocius marinistellae TaxID=2494560 RepID=A0A5J4FVT6_9FLAO|nr:glycosyl transferase [Patiriisocius marinistellae]